jgi:transposase-like protein
LSTRRVERICSTFGHGPARISTYPSVPFTRIHLRTTNPLESVFAGVRLRTDVAKRARKRENALYLVFKIVQRLGRNWRALNGGPSLMQMIAAGAVFKDGLLQESVQETEVRVA